MSDFDGFGGVGGVGGVAPAAPPIGTPGSGGATILGAAAQAGAQALGGALGGAYGGPVGAAVAGAMAGAAAGVYGARVAPEHGPLVSNSRPSTMRSVNRGLSRVPWWVMLGVGVGAGWYAHTKWSGRAKAG